jgi:hypothetical protein
MTDMTDVLHRAASNSNDALETLEAANAWSTTVRRLKDVHSIDDADKQLRDAIDAAREAGIAWGVIGDRLGMARGNAYQKYRKRPA